VDIRLLATDPLAEACDALIVPVRAGADDPLAALGSGLSAETKRHLTALAADTRFLGKRGSTLAMPTLGSLPARRIVLAGLGPDRSGDAALRAYGAAAQAARDAGARSVVALAPDGGADTLAEAVTGAVLGLYRYTAGKGAASKEDSATKAIEAIAFAPTGLDGKSASAALDRGRTVAEAVCLARDLVNEPAATLTPASFADRAVEVAEKAGLEIEVLGPEELERLGAGGILGVGKGSIHPPRMIRLRYRPATARGDRTVGLVGKCITFDTGGYSIKTHDGMLEMKGDMAGGAAVLAAMSGLPALGCPVAVEGTICAAENMISGTAFRPSDVLTAMNGVTMEIISTDAEGRLVLADGLVDTARRGATELIDLATLTGAIMVALGDGATGLFASDDRLAEELLSAAAGSGERMWRMPLYEELEEKIRGDVGDIKNSGGRYGGAITAALFLQHFREGLPWAHLDIAGSARFDKGTPLGPRGASGVGVRTLLGYLLGS